MSTITISEFLGMVPRSHPTRLPDGCAVKAYNCTLYNGKAVPLRQPSVSAYPVRLENGLTAVGGARSLYLWRRGSFTEMLAWPGVVKVASSNIADDDRYRVFVTGETGVGTGLLEPAVYAVESGTNDFTRTSIVKTTLEAPVVTNSAGVVGETNILYTYFVQTWVDAFGYMSGPSVPSTEVQYVDGQTLNVGVTQAPAGAVSRRLWKVITGEESQSFQFVWEQNASGGVFPAFSYTASDADAGEVLPEFESPPADLAWMTFVPGNFYVGFAASSPKTVLFTEQGYPTTWPLDYRYDVRDPVVGLGVCGNSVVVLTTGAPWLITGTSPGSMTVSVMQSEQACVSPYSICVMDGAVFYASADGICMSAPNGDYPVLVTNVTEKLFGKREWAALNPSTCIMQPYDGALHAWFTLADGTSKGYIFKLADGGAAVTTHDEVAKAAYYDTETDSLYYVRKVRA